MSYDFRNIKEKVTEDRYFEIYSLIKEDLRKKHPTASEKQLVAWATAAVKKRYVIRKAGYVEQSRFEKITKPD